MADELLCQLSDVTFEMLAYIDRDTNLDTGVFVFRVSREDDGVVIDTEMTRDEALRLSRLIAGGVTDA